MKYRILIAIVCVCLAAVILLNLPPAYPVEAPDPTLPHLTRPTHTTTAPEPAQVRLYCCESDWLPALTELAARYTELTGTEVVLLSPETEGCQATLSTLMESEAPPTLFCVHTENQLRNWQDTLLELTDTEIAAQLLTPELGLYQNESLLAVPMDLEAFGLLYNAELLATKAALSRKDIKDMTSLATAAQILKNNSVKAFPVADWDRADMLRLLDAADPERVREFLDMYLVNSSASGDALSLFLKNQSVFYLGSTADYSTIDTADDRTLELRNLDILPTYSTGAMQYFCRIAWGVNANVRPVDVEATMAFLLWMVTATEDAVAPVDSLQTLTAFADGAWYADQLERKVRGYMQSEPANLSFVPSPKNQTALLAALEDYLASPGDDTWNTLKDLLK